MDEKDKLFIEALFTKQAEQFQQYLGVVAENFDHKLGLIAKGHQVLSEKLDRIEGQLAKQVAALSVDLSSTGPIPRRIQECIG